MTYLIVDDNPQMREVIASFIRGLGDVIVESGDGGDAVTAFRTCQPDWVLMDITMSTVDGITAAPRITAEFPAARIVIVTNYNDEALRAAAREAGACGYVLKDNLTELLPLLRGRYGIRSEAE
jgi:CheY-like chemotaxis protein